MKISSQLAARKQIKTKEKHVYTCYMTSQYNGLYLQYTCVCVCAFFIVRRDHTVTDVVYIYSINIVPYARVQIRPEYLAFMTHTHTLFTVCYQFDSNFGRNITIGELKYAKSTIGD